MLCSTSTWVPSYCWEMLCIAHRVQTHRCAEHLTCACLADVSWLSNHIIRQTAILSMIQHPSWQLPDVQNLGLYENSWKSILKNVNPKKDFSEKNLEVKLHCQTAKICLTQIFVTQGSSYRCKSTKNSNVQKIQDMSKSTRQQRGHLLFSTYTFMEKFNGKHDGRGLVKNSVSKLVELTEQIFLPLMKSLTLSLLLNQSCQFGFHSSGTYAYCFSVSISKTKWHQVDGVNIKKMHSKQQKSFENMIINFTLSWHFFSHWRWHRSGTGMCYQNVNKLNLLIMYLPNVAGENSTYKKRDRSLSLFFQWYIWLRWRRDNF